MLENGLFLGYAKYKTYYNLIVMDRFYYGYTEHIFNLLNHPYNDIKMEHKYFDKLIQLVEKLFY